MLLTYFSKIFKNFCFFSQILSPYGSLWRVEKNNMNLRNYQCTDSTDGGNDTHAYNSDTKFQEDLNDLSCYLKYQRNEAYKGIIHAPRVIIVGPKDSGKSTLCTTLLNIAKHDGYFPDYIDLDVGQGKFPGALYSSTSSSTSTNLLPSYYFYGHTDPSRNEALFTHLVSVLIKDINMNYNYSGFIVNTFGWITGIGYDLLLQIFQLLRVNVIIVLEDHEFYNKLFRKFGLSITITFIRKSNMVVHRTQECRKLFRNNTIYHYFSYARELKFKFYELSIYSITQHKKIQQLQNFITLSGKILCNVYLDPNSLLNGKSQALAWVVNVDMESHEVTVRISKDCSLVSNTFIVGTVNASN